MNTMWVRQFSSEGSHLGTKYRLIPPPPSPGEDQLTGRSVLSFPHGY